MDSFDVILGVILLASVTTWLTAWICAHDGYEWQDWILPAVSWIAATIISYVLLR